MKFIKLLGVLNIIIGFNIAVAGIFFPEIFSFFEALIGVAVCVLGIYLVYFYRYKFVVENKDRIKNNTKEMNFQNLINECINCGKNNILTKEARIGTYFFLGISFIVWGVTLIFVHSIFELFLLVGVIMAMIIAPVIYFFGVDYKCKNCGYRFNKENNKERKLFS